MAAKSRLDFRQARNIFFLHRKQSESAQWLRGDALSSEVKNLRSVADQSPPSAN